MKVLDSHLLDIASAWGVRPDGRSSGEASFSALYDSLVVHGRRIALDSLRGVESTVHGHGTGDALLQMLRQRDDNRRDGNDRDREFWMA